MEHKLIAPSTYKLIEPGPAGRVNMYLLLGQKKALLIDSGYGIAPLKETVASLTSLPVVLFNTHGHLDHALGSYQFEAYLRHEDLGLYLEHSSAPFTDRLGKAIKKAEMKELPLGELDLGGRKAITISTPGHTRGSVCILDPATHIAFVGDTINPGEVWLGLKESTGVEEYLQSLLTLQKECEDNGIFILHSGHSAKPMNMNKLHNLIHLCRNILAGKTVGEKVDSGLCQGYRATYKYNCIIYRHR